MNRTEQHVVWRATGDARHPYEAVVAGQLWRMRLNEFPEEPSLYTLFVEGVVSEELLSWPRTWTRPGTDAVKCLGADSVERAEYLRELEHFERTRNVPPSRLVE